MARSLNRLSARTAETLKSPGRHADGGGLYLRITHHGSRSWTFMAKYAGKRREIGLGSTNALSLASARKIAGEMREAVVLGQNPRTVLTGPENEPEAPVMSFGNFADSYISSIEAGWKNEIHRRQWRQSIADHAVAICDMPIDAVDTKAVLSVLQPIWLTKPETASRVRGRIERILDAAKAQGLRSIDSSNPARFRGHLALLLPKQSKLARGHHAALAWHNAPPFMAKLRHREALSARALEFTILTAARSGETLGATWGEIDLEAKLWTIPAHRMKASVEHVVPLSEPAIALLLGLKPENSLPGDVIFSVSGAARSNMAMAQLLKRMGHGDITTHGFRSAFRDWAGDSTEFPRELIEQALAHTISNKAERAYRRGTAVEKRRGLMKAWADYLASNSSPFTDIEKMKC
jgi:integrase